MKIFELTASLFGSWFVYQSEQLIPLIPAPLNAWRRMALFTMTSASASLWLGASLNFLLTGLFRPLEETDGTSEAELNRKVVPNVERLLYLPFAGYILAPLWRIAQLLLRLAMTSAQFQGALQHLDPALQQFIRNLYAQHRLDFWAIVQLCFVTG